MPCFPEDANEAAMMRARLASSLSQSFPSGALSRALLCTTTTTQDENFDPLSESCFAAIRLEKSDVADDDDSSDDELTSLAWLQDADLLKNISSTARTCVSPIPKKENPDLAATAGVPYDPTKHAKNKPPYSFSCLIFMAIEDSPSKRLPVKDVYDWIVRNFPFFETAPTGWRNSVRHNLSLNKCFRKVDRDRQQGLGKGSSWCIDPMHRPNLLQALRRTPYHPFQQLQMISRNDATSQNEGNQEECEKKLNFSNVQSPTLFPFLSRRLSQTDGSCDSVGDVDVARTLANLSKIIDNYQRPVPSYGTTKCQEPGSDRDRTIRRLRARKDLGDLICTPYPTDDHLYSLAPSVLREAQKTLEGEGSSNDEGLDFGSDSEEDEDDVDAEESAATTDDEDDSLSENLELDKRKTRKRVLSTTNTKVAEEEEELEDEERKRLLGGYALLDLASSGGGRKRRKKELLLPIDCCSLWGGKRLKIPAGDEKKAREVKK